MSILALLANYVHKYFFDKNISFKIRNIWHFNKSLKTYQKITIISKEYVYTFSYH